MRTVRVTMLERYATSQCLLKFRRRRNAAQQRLCISDFQWWSFDGVKLATNLKHRTLSIMQVNRLATLLENELHQI
jgi:hypothetical protein